MEVVVHNFLPDALVLDVPEIDVQHEEIFSRIEWLKAVCLEANCLPPEPAADFLAFLTEHFATEERIALAAGIGFSEHARKHCDNLSAIAKAIHAVHVGHSDIFSLLRYLEYWFERHIVEEDRPFAAALRILSR